MFAYEAKKKRFKGGKQVNLRCWQELSRQSRVNYVPPVSSCRGELNFQMAPCPLKGNILSSLSPAPAIFVLSRESIYTHTYFLIGYIILYGLLKPKGFPNTQSIAPSTVFKFKIPDTINIHLAASCHPFLHFKPSASWLTNFLIIVTRDLKHTFFFFKIKVWQWIFN